MLRLETGKAVRLKILECQKKKNVMQKTTKLMTGSLNILILNGKGEEQM